MSHTPGPWRLDPEPYLEYVWGPNGEMIAMMRGVGANLPIKANALLIIAAPELLAACKQALELIEAKCNADGPTATKLRTAIQKAEGTDV